jgi:hypothetical protein
MVALAATSIAAHAHAQETPCSGCRDEQLHPEFLHMELGYERMALTSAGSNFGASGLESHSGSELGFVSPTANLIDFRWTMFAGRGIGFVSETAFGWAGSDATPTDPYAQHVRGNMIVMDFGFGIEGLVPLGGGVMLRAAAMTGPQILMIPLDVQSASSRSNSLGVVQWFVRPRLALEAPLADHVLLGTYVTDDIVRVKSWGGGGYVAFTF